jgi:hypothetical protein
VKSTNLNLSPAVQSFVNKLLNRGVSPENLKESYAYKANYPDGIKFHKNGTDLEVSLDDGDTWKKVTLT